MRLSGTFLLLVRIYTIQTHKHCMSMNANASKCKCNKMIIFQRQNGEQSSVNRQPTTRQQQRKIRCRHCCYCSLRFRVFVQAHFRVPLCLHWNSLVSPLWVNEIRFSHFSKFSSRKIVCQNTKRRNNVNVADEFSWNWLTLSDASANNGACRNTFSSSTIYQVKTKNDSELVLS